MSAHEPFDDRQAESGTPRRSVGAAVEHLEDVRQISERIVGHLTAVNGMASEEQELLGISARDPSGPKVEVEPASS